MDIKSNIEMSVTALGCESKGPGFQFYLREFVLEQDTSTPLSTGCTQEVLQDHLKCV